MASFVGHSLLTFLLFAIFSPHVHARESRAFSKVTREEVPNETVAVPEETPAVQVEKAARLSKETYGYSYNSNGDAHYDAGGFSTSFPNTKPNAKYGSYKNGESNAMYRPNYGYRKEQYGMSDTRFLENGRYFYDVNAERGHGAYAGIGVRGADNHGYGAYNSEGNGYEGNQEGEEYVP
ncbi:hypothetical protein MUK42_11612 [Musa troglodytarum]|uniref:Uncharacterized protein n=1 Tax=Musa troglodytarum TaxID=320322 RepID=A0A9E7GNI9_9LILI|nr:hypothetical protein MUK42_11612 [Musa troglodytarum]URE16259.1 hypothetical protein MUK42_11612 [Musa troglodytarum]